MQGAAWINPRLTLLEMNYFGGPPAVDINSQIHFDHADDHFRRWLKQNRITCSQPQFRPWMAPGLAFLKAWQGVGNISSQGWGDFCVEVFKKDGSRLWTAKAWNGRIICQWLHECLRDAFLRRNEPLSVLVNRAHLKSKLVDIKPRFQPPQRPLAVMSSCQRHVCEQIFVQKTAHSRSCMFIRRWRFAPVVHLRTALARWHGLVESAGRYLTVAEGGEINRVTRLCTQRYVALVKDALRRYCKGWGSNFESS